jgi:hypothetical protein
MKHLAATVTKELDKGLREVDPSELTGIEGGGFIIVPDGFCGTPVPWPPRLPSGASVQTALTLNG